MRDVKQFKKIFHPDRKKKIKISERTWQDLYKSAFREHFLRSKECVEGCREPGIAGHGADNREDLLFFEPDIETGIDMDFPPGEGKPGVVECGNNGDLPLAAADRLRGAGLAKRCHHLPGDCRYNGTEPIVHIFPGIAIDLQEFFHALFEPFVGIHDTWKNPGGD